MHKDGFLTFGESEAVLPTLDSPAAIFELSRNLGDDD